MSATMCDRVLAYLRVHEGEWVDGRDLSRVGGYAAWRTRISDLRRPPYNVTIENKVIRHGTYRQSLYRLVPAVEKDSAA